MNKRITNDERAVSGLIGEIMLIGIVIVAIGLITVSTYSYLNKDPDPPHIEVNGLANLGANEIHLKHQGGESIEGGNLRVLVNVDGTTLDPFDDDADNSNRWGVKLRGTDDVERNFDRWTLGDILVLATNMTEHPVDLTEDSEIRVAIVHRPSNRVVVSGEVFGGLFGGVSINTTPSGTVFEIVNPADGEWLKNVTELIEAEVTGTDRYDSVCFSIHPVSSEVDDPPDETDDSGAPKGDTTTSYTYNWNTTDTKCGNHTITATAYDSVWQPETDQITVCVCNTPGLVGFWRFDDIGGMADDSSCNRNHGTINGSPDQIIDGDVYAYQFNGSGAAYVEVANSISLAMTNETTVNASVNSSDAGEQYILAKGDMVFELADEVVRQDVSNLGWDPAFGGTYKRAQTFRLDSDATLNEVRVYIERAADWVNQNVTMHICDDNLTEPGAEIESVIVPWADVNTSYAWINRTVNCVLTGGTTYWIVLECPSASDGTWYHWGAGHCAGGYYPNGDAWYYNASIPSWTTGDLDDIDMTFELITTLALPTYTDRISMPDPDNFKYLVYYGWLNCTGLNWSESGLELIMVNDSNEGEIEAVQAAGVKVYYYIALGQSYAEAADKDEWEQNVTDEMDAHNYTDGFVWDELDSGYYGGETYIADFNERLDRLNGHAHDNLSVKTVANGVRYYATHCNSSYYMWESFMSTYNGTNASTMDYYYYRDFFNTTWMGDDANRSIKGIKKYEYLRDNNVLNKTLVHSYGKPNDDAKSIYNYIASRVLGMKGFSYADATNFGNATAKLTNLSEGLKWDLGTRMTRMSDDIDADAGTLSGRFTNGYVTDYVNWSFSHNSTNYTTDMISNPLTAHLLNSSSRVTGLDFCLIRGQVDFMHGVLRSSTDLTEDPDYHVLSATLDAASGTATLHIDGTLAAERTFPAGLPFDFSDQNLIIGTDHTGTAHGFNGRIDDIMIYNIAN